MKKMVFALMLGLLVVGCQPKTETVVIQGEKGERGERGEVGPRGESGQAGLSAYELAVKNGFVGTEIEWLQSLIGATGADGSDGRDGKSAYELWLEIPGNESKTLTQFIESLKGAPGVVGPMGPMGPSGSPGQSCTVTDTTGGATVACGAGTSVVIKDGIDGKDAISPTLTVTAASVTQCPNGGAVVNTVPVCFQSTVTQNIYGNTGVIKLCTSSNGSSEYGIVIGGSVYAVMHNELSSGKSNTYLAKLSIGTQYVTTDGVGCSFTLTQNMVDSVNVIKSLYMVTKQCLKSETGSSPGYETRTVLTDGVKFYEVDSNNSGSNHNGFKQITCQQQEVI